MKQLKTTIAKLKQDPLHAITVKDLQTGTKLLMNANGSYLTEQFGSVEGFFEDLHKREILEFEVQDRRKNGSSYKTESVYSVNATPKNETTSMKETVHTPEVQPANYYGSLNGPGLSMAEVNYRTFDHSRLVQELSQSKEKIERLEKDNKKLELENLEYRLEGKKSAVSAESLKSFAPVLSQILPMILAGRAGAPMHNQALMAPAGDLSPLKNQFIEMVKVTDDDMIEYFIAIAQGIATNTVFDNELSELMTKHNLLQE